MSHFGWIANKVIEKADIILEILDARFIDETRNREAEEKIKENKKILIYTVNKCDFLEKKELTEIKKELKNCVFVSATRHYGMSLLKSKIMTLASQNKIKNPVVGVIGYPNVGKSSVINSLKGNNAAPISSEAGFTKGLRLVRISKNLMMLDSPGVISKDKKDAHELVFIGAKNPSNVEDPDLAVVKIMKTNVGQIESHYKVPIKSNKEKSIEAIALKFNLKKKGNLPDIDRASRMILYDWQKGKIKRVNPDF